MHMKTVNLLRSLSLLTWLILFNAIAIMLQAAGMYPNILPLIIVIFSLLTVFYSAHKSKQCTDNYEEKKRLQLYRYIYLGFFIYYGAYYLPLSINGGFKIIGAFFIVSGIVFLIRHLWTRSA